MSKADLAALIALCAALASAVRGRQARRLRRRRCDVAPSATARGTPRLIARVSTVAWIESHFALFDDGGGR